MSHIPEIARTDAMTTQDYAYARLRQAIMLGALRPGTALTFRGLAQHLSLSPTPIREAVRRLSSENAIEVLGNRRLQVPLMTLARFEELVQLRISLETHAAERAFPYLSNVEIAVLTQLDAQMDAAIASRDLDALTQLNQAFHKRFYSLNPQAPVMSLVESLWLQLGPFQRLVIENIDTINTIDRHKEMLAAMGARDLAALLAALESDIRDGSIRAGRQMLLRAAQEQH